MPGAACTARRADEEIIENAPHDYYWGCGADGSGKNQLGKTLMRVRSILRQRPGD